MSHELEQQQICSKYKSIFVPSEPASKVGIALDTLDKKPINALRHPPENNTCGWYIWGGGEIPNDSEFFKPLHVSHLENKCPQIVKFLGLAPGWRVLTADDYLDVWYDEKLINTTKT